MNKRLNFLTRAEKIQQIVAEHYEPENFSKSKILAFRRHVCKVYPMCERQFWRYMSVDVEKEREKLISQVNN